jgi:hypothetical protein
MFQTVAQNNLLLNLETVSMHTCRSSFLHEFILLLGQVYHGQRKNIDCSCLVFRSWGKETGGVSLGTLCKQELQHRLPAMPKSTSSDRAILTSGKDDLVSLTLSQKRCVLFKWLYMFSH